MDLVLGWKIFIQVFIKLKFSGPPSPPFENPAYATALGIVLFIDSNIFVANQTSTSSKVNYEKEIAFPLFFKSFEFLSTFLRFDNVLRLLKQSNRSVASKYDVI